MSQLLKIPNILDLKRAPKRAPKNAPKKEIEMENETELTPWGPSTPFKSGGDWGLENNHRGALHQRESHRGAMQWQQRQKRYLSICLRRTNESAGSFRPSILPTSLTNSFRRRNSELSIELLSTRIPIGAISVGRGGDGVGSKRTIKEQPEAGSFPLSHR